MLRIHKKGFVAQELVKIALIVLALILIGGTIGRFLAKSDDISAEVLCFDSIAWRAKTAANLNVEIASLDLLRSELKFIPTLCKTIDKKVSGDSEKIKAKIADDMARCWWMFGEGKYDEIMRTAAAVPTAYNLDQVENQCFVCYAELIEEEEFDTISAEEMFDYMRITPYPKIANTTYLDYIQYHGGPGQAALLTAVEPRHAYGITFMAKNKEREANSLGLTAKTVGTIISGVAAGVAVGVGGAACLASVVCGAIVTVGGGTALYLGTAAGQDLYTVLATSEREVSVVALSSLDEAQVHCFRGDLAGE